MRVDYVSVATSNEGIHFEHLGSFVLKRRHQPYQADFFKKIQRPFLRINGPAKALGRHMTNYRALKQAL